MLARLAASAATRFVAFGRLVTLNSDWFRSLQTQTSGRMIRVPTIQSRPSASMRARRSSARSFPLCRSQSLQNTFLLPVRFSFRAPWLAAAGLMADVHESNFVVRHVLCHISAHAQRVHVSRYAAWLEQNFGPLGGILHTEDVDGKPN